MTGLKVPSEEGKDGPFKELPPLPPPLVPPKDEGCTVALPEPTKTDLCDMEKAVTQENEEPPERKCEAETDVPSVDKEAFEAKEKANAGEYSQESGKGEDSAMELDGEGDKKDAAPETPAEETQTAPDEPMEESTEKDKEEERMEEDEPATKEPAAKDPEGLDEDTICPAEKEESCVEGWYCEMYPSSWE